MNGSSARDEFPSTLSVHSFSLKLLCALGIFPYKKAIISSTQETNIITEKHYGTKWIGNNNSNSEIRLCSSGLCNKLNWFVIAYATFNFVFQWYQLINTLASSNTYEGFSTAGKKNELGLGTDNYIIEALNLLSWAGFATYMFFLAIFLRVKRKRICELLNNWEKVELKILHENFEKKTNNSNSMITKENSYRYRMYTYWGVYNFLILLFMVYNHYICPKYRAYLYSVIPDSLFHSHPNLDKLFFVVSLVHQVAVPGYLGCTIGSMKWIFIVFSRSITNCLLLISPPAENFNPDTDFIDKLPSSKTYHELRILVQKFNEIFSWVLFVHKFINVVVLCGLVYAPLRYLNIAPFETLIVYVISLFCYSFDLLIVLMSMGRVYEESIAYRYNWLITLANGAGYIEEEKISTCIPLFRANGSISSYKCRLETCFPFAFRSGSFYSIGSSTALTTFSIVTTYLVVLLQF